jgi:hypothetical protein
MVPVCNISRSLELYIDFENEIFKNPLLRNYSAQSLDIWHDLVVLYKNYIDHPSGVKIGPSFGVTELL